jgi:hypothetical protein
MLHSHFRGDEPWFNYLPCTPPSASRQAASQTAAHQHLFVLRGRRSRRGAHGGRGRCGRVPRIAQLAEPDARPPGRCGLVHDLQSTQIKQSDLRVWQAHASMYTAQVHLPKVQCCTEKLSIVSGGTGRQCCGGFVSRQHSDARAKVDRAQAANKSAVSHIQHLLVGLAHEADQRLQEVRRHPLPEALRPHL